ncbi:hypothetical protein F4561_001979 [Lipingzhangella halophila]|uniref:Uncharacterized protein n=1 Tax=Lipingzhangella halophila TaxID=1783352 RepID=A0A7W7RFS6_9ACTN|nr:DUF6220 domain-containing protein [Lipingzhangella halophila]MBB4931159.1 hypothetical protein [Lipingzhangella halophila]
MRKVFAGLAIIMMLVVVVQFFLAASGAFDTAPNDESFQAHRALGYGIVLFAVVLAVIAALARVSGRLVALPGLVAVLAVVQAVIGVVANMSAGAGGSAMVGQLIFGMHAVNGLAIIAVVGLIVQQAWELSGPAASAPGAGEADDSGASGPAAGPTRPAS